MSKLTPAEKVAAYIRLRDYKAQAEEEFKKSMKRVYDGMDKLENELLQDLRDLGADSLACPQGTVYQNTQMSTTVENRDAFMDHVRAHDLWEALDVKANKTFIRDYMTEHAEAFPGVKVSQRATVGVRRS